jgi:ribose transport system substrate-binding protein
MRSAEKARKSAEKQNSKGRNTMKNRTFLSTVLLAGVVAGLGSPALAKSPGTARPPGPSAAEGKSIVVLAGRPEEWRHSRRDQRRRGSRGAIGWDVRVLDGGGSIQGRTAAIGQALALKPDGIIINGFDAVEQQAALEGVVGRGIPMVAWHSGPKIGCDAPGGIFANVSTDAMTVSEVAAKWAMEDGGDNMGVVIFTDSTYQIAIDKADRIKETIEKMGGTVLEYVDTPIADTSSRMGPLTTQPAAEVWRQLDPCSGDQRSLFRLHGAGARIGRDLLRDRRPLAGSAGDGSEAAFQRIRGAQYQAITVAEPLNLQGWQLV